DKKLQNGSYVVVSENETPLEFEAGGINFTSGVQEVNSTAARSKDYIPVNENGTYTVGSNGSGITSVKIFTYDENVNFTSTFVVNTDSRFTFPTGTTNIKIFCPSAAPTRAEKLSLLDNDAFGGDTIKYNPTVTDNENDNSDIVYKFDHDPQKIAGQAITNPSDKLVLSGQELSVPVSKFTKPGTYVVSMYAKDIPKSTDTTENLLSDKWNTSASDISRTTFAKTPDGLQIVTDTASNGVNYNASYYQDIYVSSNTKYKLTGSLSSHNCQAQFVIYELDSGDNILNVINSSIADNQPTADILSADFVTGFNTSKLRVHILKGATTSSDSTGKDYVIADNMYLIKMLPDSRFDEYRRTSNISSSTIYAHRLPRADFSYRIQNGSGAFSIKNLADNQLSYDPDHADKQNKGIINFQWRWAEITGDGATTWHDGKLPETKSFRKGEQVIIWYRVQDTDGTNGIGAWSLPKVVKTDGSLTDPVALFIPNPNPLPMHDELEITDESYTPNLDGTIISRVWTIKKDGQSAKTLTFDRVDTANNKYYKRFNSMGFGRYTITLTVTDSFGMVSKPYSQMINVIDTINPIVSAVPTSGIYNDEDPATVSMNCADISQGNSNNRGLKTITYAWSKSTVQPQNNDTIHTVNITTEGVYAKDLSTTQSTDGTWYLYVKDEDYAGNTNNEGEYARYGPFTIETVKAGHFYITMMQDIGWRPYYFDINNGIDDDHDGEADRYPRRPDTDIGTAGLPVNYYSLVGFPRNYVKAGYKIKGKIDIQGTPDYAKFYVSYTVNGRTFSDTVNLVHASGETYTFEWVIPLETDDSSFVSFNLEVKKENIIFGNEKWADKWDSRNTSRQVLYIKGKATEDLYFYQSQ
ncbi:MAG TPA: hypothetical protein VHP38_08070, partial [Ruminiclostridium sp.]|nr:hypothetical protein [Ruminiclostridium sp.]